MTIGHLTWCVLLDVFLADVGQCPAYEIRPAMLPHVEMANLQPAKKAFSTCIMKQGNFAHQKSPSVVV
jgi:hypothetical protein